MVVIELLDIDSVVMLMVINHGVGGGSVIGRGEGGRRLPCLKHNFIRY